MGITTSPLKYATTSITCFSDGRGYAIGSIEGRCGIKNIDLATEKLDLPQDFCFKCHRVETEGTAKVFAVNGIAFNKQYGSFVTYGSDG